MKLIVGLGNPGAEYKGTRHNIGYLVTDQLSIEKAIMLRKQEFNSVFGTGIICGIKTILTKPQTYMNLSGEAVIGFSNYYSIPTRDIIVIHDDMDIAFGQIKIKKQGGTAGHRGIESIQEHLKSDDFLRIRTGIGKPPPNISPIDFVLQKFSDNEQETLKGVIRNVADCVEVILTQGPDAAMNRFHRTNKTDGEEPTV